MDILKAFVLDGTAHTVTILWENGKPLFRASEIGNILEIKNIRTSIVSFDEDEKVVRITDGPGGPQETLFLTESGVYRLLMNSRKPIARPFQKWVCKVLESIRETGKYELQVKIDEAKKETREECEQLTQEQIQKALEEEARKVEFTLKKNTHDAFVEAYKNKNVVYFGEICEIDGKKLIKIGSTKDTNYRENGWLKTFGNIYIFKVFECYNFRNFEEFLHNHPKVKLYRYKEEIHEGHCSNECYLITPSELDDIIAIATHNKFKFMNKIEADHLIEIEKLKLQQMQTKLEMAKVQEKIIEYQKDIQNENETYIDPVILLQDSRKHTQARGNKIQRYSKDGKTLIKTYESYVYAMRDKELADPTRNAIKEAIKTNTIYKNFRWAELDRSLPDDTIQELPDTVESKTVKIGYVAMLNLDKDKIVNVFCDQKAAAEDRKFTSSASVSNAIKRGSVSGGHYFMMWHDCSSELKEEYLKTSTLPQKRVAVNGVQVEQLHPVTNEVLKYYPSCEDIVKEYKISRQTLKSAIDYNYIVKGYKWRYKT